MLKILKILVLSWIINVDISVEHIFWILSINLGKIKLTYLLITVLVHPMFSTFINSISPKHGENWFSLKGGGGGGGQKIPYIFWEPNMLERWK